MYLPSLNSSFMACFNPLNPLSNLSVYFTLIQRFVLGLPISFLFFQSWNHKKLIDSLLWVVYFYLFRIVILVFDDNIPRLIPRVIVINKTASAGLSVPAGALV